MRPPAVLALVLLGSSAHAAPPVIPRAAWGAAPARPGAAPQTPRRITVHHTAGRSPAGQAEVAALLRAIQRYHQDDRGWPDIAYHLLIDREGRVHAGRAMDREGSSGTTYDLADRVLVCVVGDFTAELPPDAQWTSLVQTVADLCRRLGVPPGDVTQHRDLAATTCPGDALAALLDDGLLAEAVGRVLAAGR